MQTWGGATGISKTRTEGPEEIKALTSENCSQTTEKPIFCFSRQPVNGIWLWQTRQRNEMVNFENQIAKEDYKLLSL